MHNNVIHIRKTFDEPNSEFSSLNIFVSRFFTKLRRCRVGTCRNFHRPTVEYDLPLWESDKHTLTPMPSSTISIFISDASYFIQSWQPQKYILTFVFIVAVSLSLSSRLYNISVNNEPRQICGQCCTTIVSNCQFPSQTIRARPASSDPFNQLTHLSDITHSIRYKTYKKINSIVYCSNRKFNLEVEKSQFIAWLVSTHKKSILSDEIIYRFWLNLYSSIICMCARLPMLFEEFQFRPFSGQQNPRWLINFPARKTLACGKSLKIFARVSSVPEVNDSSELFV